MRALPSQTYLHTNLDYDPEKGELTWAVSRPGVSKGKPAGHPNASRKHVQVTLERRQYLAHRIIWKWMTGEDPPALIDHIDRDPTNNRWTNLRLATARQNTQNRKGWSKYLKGARPNGNGWRAQIVVDGKWLHIGQYATEIEAHERYKEVAAELHGRFACAD